MADLRTRAMVRMRRQGCTLAVIGETFGLTRERARQLLAAVGERGHRCLDCGRPTVGAAYCDKHRVERQARKAEAALRDARDLQERRKAAGLCAGCGEPTRSGRTRCGECAAVVQASARRWKERQAAVGLCGMCARPAVAGLRLCAEHLEHARDKARRFRAEHRAAGLCYCCNAPVVPGRTARERHLSATREASRARYGGTRRRADALG